MPRLEFLNSNSNYVAGNCRADNGPAREIGGSSHGLGGKEGDDDLMDMDMDINTTIGDSLKLNELSDSVSGLTVVDPNGYSDDIINNPPTSAWIEEVAWNIQAARQLIQNGCEESPQYEDLWLEASRLLSSPDDQIRVMVLRRGLEHIPHSVRLWKAVLELSSSEQDARRTLLHRAVECCPFNLEFWLALARLETYDNAKRVLNTARMKLPKEPAIWIAAAKLEEANGNTSMVGTIIQRGIHVLQRKGLVIGREAWMKEAEAAQRAGSIATCQAIIKKTIAIGVQGEENRMRIWVTDAEECKKRVSTKTARAILQETYAAAMPNSEEIWLAAFKLEFENREPERARLLLAQARERVGTERVWMKSAILERELGNTEQERRLLDQGLNRFPSFFKLWLMLGQLEERLGHLGKAKEVYESSLNHCSSYIQLWLSLAYLEEKITGLSNARAVLAMARKEIPHNPELWLAAVRAESRHGNKEEANMLMTEALQECPNSGILWAASIDMVPRLQLKRKCIDAVKKFADDLHVSFAVAKKFANDPHVSAAVAKLLWHIRKVDEARMLLNRAVTLAPDIGDFWALYYKFEIQHGTLEDQKDVLKWCIAAQPKHGERWQKIAKAVENAHQQTEAILTQVLLALVKEENAQNN